MQISNPPHDHVDCSDDADDDDVGVGSVVGESTRSGATLMHVFRCATATAEAVEEPRWLIVSAREAICREIRLFLSIPGDYSTTPGDSYFSSGSLCQSSVA